MINVAVVEDDEVSAKTLERYLKRYGEETGEDLNVTRFCDGDEIASDYKPLFHIIFLDIEMRRLDGMRTAEIIRTMDRDVILIFVTNMAQYAIKGYAVDALDFLLKPLPYFAFSQQMKKCVERIKCRNNCYLLLPTENGIIKMDVSQIVYIESIKHKMFVHTSDETYVFTCTMRELEEKLLSRNFFRCNNGYLVNLAHVKRVAEGCATVGKFELLISRPRKKAFMEALAAYVGGGMQK